MRWSAAAAADYSAHGFIRTEILSALHIEQRAELRSGAVDAALDGPDRTSAYGRRVFIGKSGSADQDQCLALVLWKLVERGTKFLELQMRVLGRLGLQRLCIAALGVLYFAPTFAIIGAEEVAKDREQPSRQVGPRLERVDVGQRSQQRLLYEIVGSIAVTAERNRKRSQAWH